ncbi:MAG: SH3 domain-containing protein [Gemmobacter sp.]
MTSAVPGARVELRFGPGIAFPAVGTLAPGETVRNLGCEGIGAARWCRIRSTVGADITGWVYGRFLREGAAPRPPAPPAPPAGGGDAGAGPDTWVVRGLPAGDRLNLRGAPTTQAPVLATLREGERLANLGCEMVGSARWCRVRTLGGVTVTGWVSGRYLREG